MKRNEYSEEWSKVPAFIQDTDDGVIIDLGYLKIIFIKDGENNEELNPFGNLKNPSGVIIAENKIAKVDKNQGNISFVSGDVLFSQNGDVDKAINLVNKTKDFQI